LVHQNPSGFTPFALFIFGSFQQRGAIDYYIGEKQFDDKNYGEVNFCVGV
jgi:hypothetical protein